MSDHTATTDQEWLGEIRYLSGPTGESSMIAMLQVYWERLRDGRVWPRRTDFDPTEIYTCLPYLSVLQYHRDPFRVQFRLIGNEVARLYGNAAQGKFLDEMGWAPQDLIDTAHIYHRLYDEKRPLFGLSYTNFESKADRIFEWAVFPMSDDGEHITHCISLDDYTMVTPRKPRSF